MTYALEHAHTRQAIRDRLARGPSTNYLRDWIYGGVDGAITTFAIVAGVAGADLSVTILLILGFANLLADGFAMGASNFIATKSERDDYEPVLSIERRHLAVIPDGEREEIRQIFAAKGFAGDDLDRVVNVITSDKNLWTKTMATEEYGLSTYSEVANIVWLQHFYRVYFLWLHTTRQLSLHGQAGCVRDRYWSDLLCCRCDQEPLVTGRLDPIQHRDINYWHGRGSSGVHGRFRS
jgi:hypothetical protein